MTEIRHYNLHRFQINVERRLKKKLFRTTFYINSTMRSKKIFFWPHRRINKESRSKIFFFQTTFYILMRSTSVCVSLKCLCFCNIRKNSRTIHNSLSILRNLNSHRHRKSFVKKNSNDFLY